MSYDFYVDIAQGALCIATLGLIGTVVHKMLAGTIPLAGLLAGRANGKAQPERILTFTTAVALPMIYLLHCAITAKDAAVPRALPDAEPWMLAALLASQALYLGGKFFRTQNGRP
jgi:hypothetical protein